MQISACQNWCKRSNLSIIVASRVDKCIDAANEKNGTRVLTQQMRKTVLIVNRENEHQNPFLLQSSYTYIYTLPIQMYKIIHIR